DLAAKIDEAFGSLDELNKQLAERGAGHFASGWVWLAEKGGKLSIEETHDGDTLADSSSRPLLTIDLWEHAYYLDHQNKRPDYLKAALDKHLNWDFAAENLARGATRKYPSSAYAKYAGRFRPVIPAGAGMAGRVPTRPRPVRARPRGTAARRR